MTTTKNLYLTGNLAPVSAEITASELEVIGSIPPQLDGRYLRNGPNPVGDVDAATYNWFTGAGMVHGIRLRDGRAEWYRNRWVRSPAVAEALGEEPPPNPLPADRPVFAANTNVIGLAGKTFAIVEAGGAPMELTDELETVGPSDLGGTLPLAFSAHPKRDPATGRLHVAAYWWGWGSKVQYLTVGVDGRVEVVQDVELPGDEHSPMMHDLSITETRAVLYDMPCVFDIGLATGGDPLPYAWHPELGARIGVLPLGGGPVTWVELDRPCYVYHPLNAFDLADGRLQLDVVVHEQTFAGHRDGPGDGRPTLQRWTVDVERGAVAIDVVDDRPQEFPRVDERLVGRRARYGYTVQISEWDQGGLYRHDLETGKTAAYDHGPGRSTMEAVFVPASDGSDETDGWLLSYVHDAASGRGELVLLDAADFEAPPVARVLLPARIPHGFHGNWIPTGA